MKNSNHQADIKNANKGLPGQNQTHSHNQGNRGKQLNTIPNNANQHQNSKKGK